MNTHTLLLLVVLLVAAAVVQAVDDSESNKADRKRVRRHRNVLQISEADVSVLNSLWELDGFGQQQHHARTLKGDKKDKASKGMKKGKKGDMKGMKGMKVKTSGKDDKGKMAGESFSFFM